MLYPQQTGITEPDDTEGTIPTDEGADTEESKLIEERKRSGKFVGEELDEEPVGMANQYLPSAMGFTQSGSASIALLFDSVSAHVALN